jgi:hypothetical protein
LLGTADIQSLADLGNSFEIVHEMQVAPVTRTLAVQLLIQAGLPLVPVVLVGTPTSELVKAIVKMIV